MQLLVLRAPLGDARWLTSLADTMGLKAPANRVSHAIDVRETLARRVSLLNLDILESLQSRWYHVDNVTLGADPRELPAPIQEQIEACAADVNRPGRWLCDDPAMCILLPYWLKHLRKPRCLLYIEHPMDIAHRLRDDWQFPIAFGIALWEYYMRSALIATEGPGRLVVAPRTLARDPETALRALGRQLASHLQTPPPDDAAIARIAAMTPPVVSDRDPEQTGFLHKSQHAFYQALSTGAVDSIEPERISAESRDILQFHGRLRAGFDCVRKDRDALRRQLAAEPLARQAGADADGSDTAAPAPQDSVEDTELVEATIHLRGMEPLHLSCAHDNPMLPQLIQSLARSKGTQDTDEVIYLEMGETTLYFPISLLQAVETNHGTAFSGNALSSTTTQVEQTISVAGGGPRKSVAILVLGCLSPHYERCLDTIQGTWAAKHLAGMDVYFALGAHLDPTNASAEGIEKYFGGAAPPLAAFEARRIGNVIACGCADTIQLQNDCLLRKRLIAFNYLALQGTYDFVYTVCASSYVDQAGLRACIDTVDSDMLFHGPVGVCQFTRRPYVSGASMLLSIDLVQRLAQDAYQIVEDNGGRYADDVALGSWIARHVSDTSEERIIENIIAGRRATGDNTFVMPGPPGMIDYVGVNPSHHVRVDGAHHYHFSSGTIEQMSAFHRHYFE